MPKQVECSSGPKKRVKKWKQTKKLQHNATLKNPEKQQQTFYNQEDACKTHYGLGPTLLKSVLLHKDQIEAAYDWKTQPMIQWEKKYHGI